MNVLWGSEREPELNKALIDWASWRLFGNLRGFGPCTTMGVFDEGTLIGVMVYHNFDRAAQIIEISGVSGKKEWLKRHVLWEMFSYPFNELGCQMLMMRVSEKNRQWNGRGLPRLLKAYGFTSITVPRLYGRDEAGILFCLADDDWRANGFHREHKQPKPVEFSPVHQIA